MERRLKENERIMPGSWSGTFTGTTGAVGTAVVDGRTLLVFPGVSGQFNALVFRSAAVGTGTAIITMSVERVAEGASTGTAISTTATYDLDVHSAANTKTLLPAADPTFTDSQMLVLFRDFDGGTATVQAQFAYVLFIQI